NTYLNLLRSKEVAGIIVNIDAPSQNDIQELVASVNAGFPIVSLDYWHETIHSVVVDKLEGVRRALGHLLQLGHRRIACITFAPVRAQAHASKRLRVYREVLEEAGIAYDETLVRNGAYDPETGYQAMKSLLELSPLPTALFAMNDIMAFGAMTAIHEAGLRIPEDISVIGFDDIRLARYSTPALTTVREPDILHGATIGQMLINLINGTPLEQDHVVLKTELKIRDSSAYCLH
ncbi:MAG: substrate-binding domain-containing protein, partial [Chloroflexota bacterium]